jgi:hypothetical protein
MTRYDLISPREDRNGKTRWQKIGAAFPRDKGGFSLVFDALPLPDKEGQVRLLMTEPLPRDGDSQPRNDRRDEPPARDRMDDEIPF